MIRILTLFNKAQLVLEAIASVEAQTRRDYIHFARPDTYRARDGRYPPAVYYNEMARIAPMEDYISWLSDDDLLFPNYVADLAGHLDAHPEIDCVYGGSKHVLHEPPQEDRLIRNLPQQWPFPLFNAELSPFCQIDGGQFMIRRSGLEKIPYPWYPEDAASASGCDAIFMRKISQYFPMYPIPVFVMTNRATSASCHTVAVRGHLEKGVGWKPYG